MYLRNVAKSDQLNAVDILGADRIIRIRDVKVPQAGEQPVSVFSMATTAHGSQARA